MSGAWMMTDEGEFVLSEPFATQLTEAKRVGTLAWQAAVFNYLADNSIYDNEFISQEFIRRVMEDNLSPMEIVDEFVIEALEGTLHTHCASRAL